MSIAVLNWVWTSSPTSGNQRLVLLALADACSRDDGTGCWPATATIARKANISVRTVQRVIAGLEADGHLIVHRGQGGSHRSTNSYTVVIHNGCQSDGRQTVTRDTGDTPGVTQLCHPRGDTGVTRSTKEPPRTTTTRATRAHEPATGTETPTGGGAENRRHEDFHAALGDRWSMSARQRKRLAPLIGAALAAGWTPTALASHVGANTDGVRNPYAVLRSRLGDLPDPPADARRPNARPPWCGACDEHTRLVELPGDDRDGVRVTRCPTCHPTHGGAAA